ncbi:MAG: TIGR04255 family protein [Candidatus Binatia bacterium]
MAEQRTLPEYDQPPVIETLLGVQFDPIERFSILHFGVYWTGIKSDYPSYELQPPLGSLVEKFGEEAWKKPGVRLELLHAPEVRCWFTDKSGTRLIQVQRDRFIHNWRKVKDEDVYPRYAQIKPKFFDEWEGLNRFLEQADLGKPEVNQCEVTYVNHIEMGKAWASFGELNKVISCWSGSYSGDFLPGPESVLVNASFVIPGQRGRLHVALQRAIRTRDAKEVLQLTLTARGKPASSRSQDIAEWFDLGHEWIVRGFTDLTTKEMHKTWGRKL